MKRLSSGTSMRYDDWRSRSARNISRERAANGKHRNGESSKGLSVWWKLLIALSGVAAIGMLAALACAAIVYEIYADDLIPPEQLAINEPSPGAKILDRNGTLLYEYVDDKSGLRRPVSLADVSEAFLAATIATEDDSFFTNPGVNFRGLARAGAENIGLGDGDAFGGSGGSSITQQLVKNVYISEEERQERWSQQGINRKLKEIVYAMELTEHYSKEQILEWYVNQISYGGVYNGVEAAAQGYFGKSVNDLTLAEAATLAGVPQSPAAYDPVNNPEGAVDRRNQILDLMLRQGPIQIGAETFFAVTPEQVEAARREPLQISERRFPIEAPHFVLQYVQPQLEALWSHEELLNGGLVVTTSLDLDLQYRTAEIMEGWIREYENASNSHDGSMMIMDPRTGEVLVMLGSRDYWNDSLQGQNNNATSCNSPGSAFKPFAYITTFRELGWAPGTMILDTPVSFSQGPGLEPFVPRNPAGNFQGPVSLRNALGNSLNIPANKAAAAVGPDKVVTQAQEMGFADTFKVGPGGCSASDFYGPAVATGGVSVTLEEMMIGYSVLANGGVMRGMPATNPADAQERPIDPVTILNVTDAKGRTRFDIEKNRQEQRVLEEEYTYLLWDILSDPQAQCLTFGCGGVTIPGYKAAVKTGTSEPYPAGHPCADKIGETWTFAYSPDLVVGIWAGNSDNDCITNLFSTSISFRSARDVFRMAHEGRAVTQMPRPPEVVGTEGGRAGDLYVRSRLAEAGASDGHVLPSTPTPASGRSVDPAAEPAAVEETEGQHGGSMSPSTPIPASRPAVVPPAAGPARAEGPERGTGGSVLPSTPAPASRRPDETSSVSAPVEEPEADEPLGWSTPVEETEADELPGWSTPVEEPEADETPGGSTPVEEPEAEEYSDESSAAEEPEASETSDESE